MTTHKILKNQNYVRIDTHRDTPVQDDRQGYTLKIVLSGETTFRFGKRRIDLQTDTCLMLRPGCSSETIMLPDQEAEIVTITFSDSFLNQFSRRFGIPRAYLERSGFSEARYPVSSDMRITSGHLKRHLQRGNSSDELLNEYLHHCLFNYMEIFRNEVLLRMERLRFSKESTREEVMKRLHDAREYISSNYNRNVSLQEAADIACLSVNHFMRTFKDAYGYSPHQYLIQLRLKRARYLLRHTGYALNEIVNMVGFECPSSFIRLFRQNFTVTPLKYRASKISMMA